MKVSQLVALLSKFPADADVLVTAGTDLDDWVAVGKVLASGDIPGDPVLLVPVLKAGEVLVRS